MNFLIFFLLFTITASANEKQLWKEAVQNAPTYPEGQFSGRGIVIPAGGEYYLINAYVNFHMLRESGCTLPVEIWYIGQEEIVPSLMNHFEELGCTCKDITQYFDYPIKGFEVKVHAIAASRFQEVLLLDADNVALKNPEFLFDTEEYQETGALFWPDSELIVKDNLLWEVLELPPKTMRAQESGQVLIDKKRCWLPLQLCVHMNKESHFYYQHIFGDKDTFLLSWMALKSHNFVIQHIPGCVQNKKWDFISDVKCCSFIQRDIKGDPLFCHSSFYDWAQRIDNSLFFYYFTLPDYPLSYHIGWGRVNRTSKKYKFQDYFPDFEIRCLKYMQEAKGLI